MEKGLPDEDTPERVEGSTLHSYQAHPEFDRGFLKPGMQELLRLADELDEKLFETVIQNEKLLDSDEYIEKREFEIELQSPKTFVGHIDLCRRYPKRGVTIIRDSKFGYIPVESAALNLQLRGYAVLSPDEVVYVAITQPRAAFGERITVARYTHKDIIDSLAQIDAIFAACAEKDAPLRAGDHCRYCKARSICPELARSIKDGLIPVETSLPSGLSKAAKLQRVEAILAQIPEEQLSKMLISYGLIGFIADPMMAEARRRIRDGKMEDWKLSKASERRRIVNSQKAISLLALAGMAREDIMECTSLSLTKLEDKLNHGQLRMGQVITGTKDAKEFTSRVLQSVIEIEIGLPRVLKK
jgi:hypothetical protein